MEKIIVNGVEIAFELSGPETAPVVTLSHSLAASMAMWDAQMPALAGRYRVLRYDLRGHGASSVPAPPYTFADLATDVFGLWDHLDVARSHFVGLSIGGMIGQQLGLKHADRLLSLSLCATRSDAANTEAPDLMAEQAKAGGLEAVVEATLKRWFTDPFLETDPAAVEQVRRMILATPVDGYLHCRQTLKTLAFADLLPAIRTPTFVIVGRQDQGTPVESSELIHARISGSRLVVLENASHLLNIEQADAFNAALGSFLDDH